MSMGVGLFQIATDAGVSWTTLQRFMQREQSLSLRDFDLLCASLELRLVPRRRTE
jgi:hypothetical protein